MSRPDGAHTHGGGDFGHLIGVLGGAAAIAAVAWLIATFLWLIALVAGAVVVVAVAGAVAMRRKYARVPQVLPWEARAALPPPDAEPLTARPVQALSAPQEFHLHLHGPLTPAQLAEVAAIREYRREP